MISKGGVEREEREKNESRKIDREEKGKGIRREYLYINVVTLAGLLFGMVEWRDTVDPAEQRRMN